MSNRVPEQCRELCPLARRDLEEFPIVFSRNCSGPEAGDERGIEKKIHVTKEGRASVEPGIGTSLGYLVCVNTGANLSLDALTEQSNT